MHKLELHYHSTSESIIKCFVPKPLEMSLAHRQIAYSVSVTISRAYGCQGNCDITADKVMHENSNSWGAVAR